MKLKRSKKVSLRLASLLLAIAPALTMAGSCAENAPTAFANIRGQGSASAFPVFSILKDEVENTMQYLGNGSGEGVKVATQNLTSLDFGVSSSTKLPQNATEVAAWQNGKYRTITFALDAIGLMINWPGGLVTIKDEKPILILSELSKIYDTSGASSTTWGKLIENLDLVKSSPSTLAATPRAVGREHGKSASGAADAFWEVLSKNMAAGLTPDFNHESLIETGGETSAEANSTALSVVENIEGSITYISLGYALKNASAKYVVPAIKTNSGKIWFPTIENAIKRDYAWVRPFNMYFSVSNQKAMQFVSFLLDPERGQRFMTFLDYIALTRQQIESQVLGTGAYPRLNEQDAPGYEGFTSVMPKPQGAV